MSLEDKIKKAKPTSWVTEGIPRWKVWLIIRWARIKVRLQKVRIRNEKIYR